MSPENPPVAGIVLASGEGSRLRTLTGGTPKCLSPLIKGWEPLALSAGLLLVSGASRVVAVVRRGWTRKAEAIINQKLSPLGLDGLVEVLENPQPEKGPAHTLYLGASKLAEEGVFLAVAACCDTLAHPRVYTMLVTQSREASQDAVMAGSRYGELINPSEASRIRTGAWGWVEEAGKSVDEGLYDMGLFIVRTIPLATAYKELLGGLGGQLYELFTQMSQRGWWVSVIDTTPLPWTEVDTPEDVNRLSTPQGALLVKEALEALEGGRQAQAH